MCEDLWWTISEARLVIAVSALLVLSCGQTDRQSESHTHTFKHRCGWSLYSCNSNPISMSNNKIWRWMQSLYEVEVNSCYWLETTVTTALMKWNESSCDLKLPVRWQEDLSFLPLTMGRATNWPSTEANHDRRASGMYKYYSTDPQKFC